MSSFVIASLFFACMFAGTLVGNALQRALPEHHLDPDSRDTMKLGVGLIATMTALVLGLVTADAKNSFQTMDTTMKTLVADALTLDRYLAQYGAESQPIRQSIKTTLTERLDQILGDGAPPRTPDTILLQQKQFESLEDAIAALPTSTDKQARFKAKAQEALDKTLQKRWLFLAQGNDLGLPIAFLCALAVWLSLIFGSFGLYAPRNRTVQVMMLACCFSVSASVFLILELSEPFSGIIQVSPKPLRMSLEMLGR